MKINISFLETGVHDGRELFKQAMLSVDSPRFCLSDFYFRVTSTLLETE